jgi:hypothetical protein
MSEQSGNKTADKRMGRPSKIETLNCFEDVKNMFLAGYKIPEISKFIHEEAKECLDIERFSLNKSLQRYITNNLPKEQLKEIVPSTVSMLKDSLQENIDPIHALNILLAIQMDRVMIEYAIEKNIGKTMTSNTKSVDVAAKITHLLDRATSEDLVRRLKGASQDKTPGDTLDNIGKLHDAYAQRYGEVAANVIANPDARRRILNIMEKIEKGNSGPLFDMIYKKLGGDKIKTPTVDISQNTELSKQDNVPPQDNPS